MAEFHSIIKRRTISIDSSLTYHTHADSCLQVLDVAGRSATAQGHPDPVRLRPAADNGTRTADAHVRVSVQRLSARKD